MRKYALQRCHLQHWRLLQHCSCGLGSGLGTGAQGGLGSGLGTGLTFSNVEFSGPVFETALDGIDPNFAGPVPESELEAVGVEMD